MFAKKDSSISLWKALLSIAHGQKERNERDNYSRQWNEERIILQRMDKRPCRIRRHGLLLSNNNKRGIKSIQYSNQNHYHYRLPYSSPKWKIQICICKLAAKSLRYSTTTIQSHLTIRSVNNMHCAVPFVLPVIIVPCIWHRPPPPNIIDMKMINFQII